MKKFIVIAALTFVLVSGNAAFAITAGHGGGASGCDAGLSPLFALAALAGGYILTKKR
ncbi:MAG: hypothetical protein LBK91_07595 [Synergistaceae bacterium]|nr:hypothetical protein [Synergistaceae bacterium]